MPKGPLAFVPFEEFKRRTSVFGRRTGDIERVDAAYRAYQESQSDFKKKQLHRILGEYLYNRGGAWEGIKRNTESGGLMEWIYCETATPRKTFDARSAAEKDAAALVALQNRDIPHSRFGVLYLFGNIDIEMGWSIALEGVSAVGGAIGTSVSTNFNQLHNDKLVDKTFNLGAIKDIKGADATSGLAAPFSLASKATSSTGTTGFQKQFTTTPQGLAPVKPNKRALPGFPASRAMFDAVADDPLLMLNPYTIAGTVVGTVGAALYDAFNNLRVLLINAVTDLFHWIRDKLIVNSEWGWSVGGTVISKAIRFVVGKCLESAAPLIGGAMDIGGGILKTIKAAKERIETWLLRRKIRLNPGHPEELANSIEGEMTKGIFAGLWTILKGVANTALAVLLPGAGSLVGALVTGIEWLIKLAWRLWERSKIKSWLEQARAEWAKEKKLCELAEMAMRLEDPTGYNLTHTGPKTQLHPYLDPAGGGLIHKLPEFTAFYKKGCDASPLIPMLTLNSGICGSLMVLLRMFEDSGKMVSQHTFNQGTEYFTKLKQFGREYLEASGFTFSPLQADNASVRGLLNHAVNHHTGEKSMVDKVLAFGSSLAD